MLLCLQRSECLANLQALAWRALRSQELEHVGSDLGGRLEEKRCPASGISIKRASGISRARMRLLTIGVIGSSLPHSTSAGQPVPSPRANCSMTRRQRAGRNSRAPTGDASGAPPPGPGPAWRRRSPARRRAPERPSRGSSASSSATGSRSPQARPDHPHPAPAAGGRDQHEPADALRVRVRELLRGHATEGEAEDVHLLVAEVGDELSGDAREVVHRDQLGRRCDSPAPG